MLHTLTALKPFRSSIALSQLAPSIREILSQVTRSPHWSPLAKAVNSLARAPRADSRVDFSGDVVRIELGAASAPATLKELCERLIPWRVGPYQLGTVSIDSEWRSQVKWGRIAPLLGDLRNTRVADVGCSSGYFLFKLANLHPELVVGFDPVERCWLQFALLQAFVRHPRIAFVPTGISTVDTFPEFFDLALCMGVLYHQRDPFTACKKLFAAVKPGGRVFLETLTIPEAGPRVLIPAERYAKMRNAWIIPSPEAAANFLTRAGFRDPEIHTFGAISTSEQRRTSWAPYESLQDFLDPSDNSKTVEGYPAPHSALVVARKE